MNSIKIKRRISSSTLKIKELDKFINKDVQIVISPLEKKEIELKELLNISEWDISEKDIRVESWKVPNY
ncbi:MAG: hypothetical protein JEY94_04135 [Melioribacteraceae bacterium]|nr:hypothetical protein [Melioribacteraceae bacterium]